MAANPDRPWDSWNVEMPSATSPVDCPDFDILNSKDHLRLMLGQTREKFFERAQGVLRTENAAVVLAGGKTEDFELYDTDTEHTYFRQEAFFRYLFGLNEPDAVGVIDLERRELILFVTYFPVEYERFLGARRPLEYYTEEYAVTLTRNTEELDAELQARGITNLYLLHGTNSDSGLSTKTTASFEGMDKYWTDKTLLYPLLAECRVCKTPAEIDLLRAACKVTSQAHVYVMRHAKPGMVERQMEALFRAWSYYYGGARHQAYNCICCAGNNGATLHYGHAGYPNDCGVADGDRLVLDMGSEYNGYATDITTSYPVNGVFTDDQRAVHNAVYESAQAVLQAIRPGVSWVDMHRLSETVILRHLLRMGIVRSSKDNEDDAVKELMENDVASMFMPHGLGHFVGLLVHDVGGYTEEFPASEELGLCWLRTTRDLEADMVLTVEPGLYFNDCWFRQMREKKPNIDEFINDEVLARFLGTGGCRLEDVVRVTEDGVENFTIVPRTCEEIEAVMAVQKM